MPFPTNTTYDDRPWNSIHRPTTVAFMAFGMSPSLSIDYVRMLVCFYLGWCYVLAKRVVAEEPRKRPMCCSECGGELHLVMITDHVGRVLYEHPLPYLDSG